LSDSKIDEQEHLIYSSALKLLENGERVIFLGGDHSISYHLVRAFNTVNFNSRLIVFDAHADAMPSMKDPSHKEWLRALVKEGFKPENIFLVGLRRIKLEERAFLDKNHVNYIELGKVEDFEIYCDGLMEFASQGPTYLSIDIDVVDPAFAPSTGDLEPGGLSSREILYFARRLNLLKNIKAIDLVEIDSESDKQKNNVTVKLGARILKEFL
jgi:arginase family enzyme